MIPTVGEKELLALLELVNPKHLHTEAEKFRTYRNRAVVRLLIDTPIRRSELGGLRVDDVDLDAAMVKVMGKGRRERWMPLGEASLVALWDYLRVRCSRLSYLWLGEDGRPLATAAIYILTGFAIPSPSPTYVTGGLSVTFALLGAGDESRRLTSVLWELKMLLEPIGSFHPETDWRSNCEGMGVPGAKRLVCENCENEAPNRAHW